MQWIYQLNRARVVRGEKLILDDVTLSFLPGAKIGVVGPNGAGKSTLLRVMAGLERPSNGDARLAPGISVGLLAQEPVLDETQDRARQCPRRRRRHRGAADPLSRRSPPASPRTTATSSSPKWVRCRSNWTIATPGISTLASSRPWTRCAARPPTPTCTGLSGGERRRVALCRLLLAAPGPAAAGRADQPSRRRERAMARSTSGRLSGHRRRSHPRPLLPRQRRRVDPRARPRPRLPLSGQLRHLPRHQGRPAAGRGPQGRQAAAASATGTGVGALRRQGAAGEKQCAAAPLRGDGRRGGEDPPPRLRRDPHPARARGWAVW